MIKSIFVSVFPNYKQAMCLNTTENKFPATLDHEDLGFRDLCAAFSAFYCCSPLEANM